MTPTPSFAPLAGRLAAKAAEIRPAEGVAISWANFMALFWCAIFEMLIALCEALDARAAADARLLAAPRDDTASAAPAARRGCQARPNAVRPPRLALAPEVQAMAPKPDDAGSGTAKPARDNQSLPWVPHLGPDWVVSHPPWRFRRETRLFPPEIQHVYIVTMY